MVILLGALVHYTPTILTRIEIKNRICSPWMSDRESLSLPCRRRRRRRRAAPALLTRSALEPTATGWPAGWRWLLPQAHTHGAHARCVCARWFNLRGRGRRPQTRLQRRGDAAARQIQECSWIFTKYVWDQVDTRLEWILGSFDPSVVFGLQKMRNKLRRHMNKTEPNTVHD